MTNITPGKIKRLRNLSKFKDSSDQEIEAYLSNRPEKVKVSDIPYQKRYDQKLKELQDEYGIDMNTANDAENLRLLIRLSIQAEDADKTIREMQSSDTNMDDRQVRIKNMGDFQRGLITSINDLQDKLGITRKVRKEKQIDDIPQYLKEIRRKANEYWNRVTVPIRCEKCQIELVRYWLNFPDLTFKAGFELQCWRCEEKIIYVR